MKFCGECGAALGDAPRRSDSVAPGAAERDPRAYTPKHLADKILASKSALEGERKQVTVLFADVKSSMELAEAVDPEEWHRILDRFFQILADGVHRFEGTVNQYTGDGIMALFGAPIAHEDHAQRACYAALHLREELRRYADELRLSRGLSFATRIGLNSGEVVVGKIGADLRMDDTAQGHTVGLAQRMEQLAAPGTVLIAESTVRLARDYFQLRDLGPASIRGASEPVAVIELLGAGALRPRVDVSRARGLSRFVGRSDEMATLEAALERAITGQGCVVGVVAVAGTGKSRLCFELAERCRTRGISVRTAHGVSHGKNVPFLPVLELLRGFFDVGERDPAQTARNKIAGAALLLDRALEPELPLLFDLLGVSDPERPSAAMEAEERSRRLLAVVRRLIEARSKREPGVLLIEDLHWIDASTEAFLASAVEATARTRTLLLVNFRPEYHAPWMARAHYQQIPLLPLSAQGVRELVRDLLGPDPSVARLGERILERSAGNPFFIEEIVRGLAESGALSGTRGARRLARAVETLELPETVLALLAARIDRLAEREKRVLSAASVIGLRFAEPLLRGAVELPEAELADALQSLVAAELVYEESLYPQQTFAFTHPLTQDVAYRSQLSTSRARLHHAVARALGAAHAGALDEHAALLSHHHEQAGDALAAAEFADRAAEWSLSQGSGDASSQWQRVADLLASLAPSPETKRLRLRALVGLSEFGVEQSIERGLELFEEGRKLADELHDPVSLTRLRARHGRLLSFQGRTADALEWASAAMRDADQTTDLRLQVTTRGSLAVLLGNRGELHAALAMNDEARSREAEIAAPYEYAGSRRLGIFGSLAWYRGTLLSRLGRLDEAGSVLERALADVQSRHPLDATTLLVVLAQVAWYRGDGEAAYAQSARALELVQRGSERLDRYPGIALWLGVGLAMRGAFDESEVALEQSLAEWRESELSWHAVTLARLAEVRLGRGDLSRAAADSDEAIALAREGSFEIWLLDALLVRARVRRVADGISARDAIERELAEIEELLARTGARSFAPRLHLERAELARLLGDEGGWRDELRRAQAVYREIGAPGQADRLERELAP